MKDFPDISPSATKKAVIEKSALSPFTLYPAGVGLLGGLAIGLFGLNPITLAAVGGGIGLGATTFGINYFLRYNSIEKLHLEQLFSDLKNRRIKTLEQLRKNLKELQDDDASYVREYAQQGKKQFAMVEERFETLKQMLGNKLKVGELTYLRYLGASESVFVAVLDNLERAVSLLKGTQAIDNSYIESRLDSLKSLENPTKDDEVEFQALNERQNLANEQKQKISSLLTQNEVAITKMDQLNASLANLTIIKGRSAGKLEQAIDDMERLASRVHQYE